MIEVFGSALVTFLVIIDPPGCAPIFASLTRGTPGKHRRAMAIRSSLIAWAILMFFALLGRPMLQALGISPNQWIKIRMKGSNDPGWVSYSEGYMSCTPTVDLFPSVNP